jgi:hypothetical protein
MLTFKRVVLKAAIDDRNQCVALDVTRKGKFSVRLFNVPLLLKLGGSLSVICEESEVRFTVALMIAQKCYILPSRRNLWT